MLTAFILAGSLAPPSLPILSDATLDEAFARHWQSTALIVLVGNEQMTQADWDRSVWADPELTAFLHKRRWPVVYADIEADRAATWFMQVDSTPAAILFTGNRIVDRRFGAASSDDAEHMIRWLTAPSTGATLADQLVKQADANPADVNLRIQAIKELDRAGRSLDVMAQHAWLLDHNAFLEQGPEVKSEAEARAAILWTVAGLREKGELWSEHAQADPPRRPTSAGWVTAFSLADAPDLDASHPWSDRQRLARIVVELRRALERRRDDGSATEQDLFILRVLICPNDEFHALNRQDVPVRLDRDGESLPPSEPNP